MNRASCPQSRFHFAFVRLRFPLMSLPAWAASALVCFTVAFAVCFALAVFRAEGATRWAALALAGAASYEGTSHVIAFGPPLLTAAFSILITVAFAAVLLMIHRRSGDS